MEQLFSVHPPAEVSGGIVTFLPGARSAWHTHPFGQILVITAGTGRVQMWGELIQTVHAGDVVIIPAHVKRFQPLCSPEPQMLWVPKAPTCKWTIHFEGANADGDQSALLISCRSLTEETTVTSRSYSFAISDPGRPVASPVLIMNAEPRPAASA